MFSSGDSGDELANTGIKQADYSASDPYVTAVGGTSTAIGATGKISFQTGWGTEKYSLSSDGKSWSPVGFLYGAGGGTSTLFNQPAYQVGTTSSPYRQVPDVAMDADPNTGMLVGETQTFPNGVYYDEYRIGGTSLASPLFAGMTALALQKAGHPVGLLNPTIYKQQATAFTDVKGNPPQVGDVRVDFANGIDATNGLVYSVRTFDQDSSLRTTRGYDLTTGVGAPNPNWLTAIG
jgi:subtilase family serine protease